MSLKNWWETWPLQSLTIPANEEGDSIQLSPMIKRVVVVPTVQHEFPQESIDEFNKALQAEIEKAFLGDVKPEPSQYNTSLLDNVSALMKRSWLAKDLGTIVVNFCDLRMHLRICKSAGWKRSRIKERTAYTMIDPQGYHIQLVVDMYNNIPAGQGLYCPELIST